MLSILDCVTLQTAPYSLHMQACWQLKHWIIPDAGWLFCSMKLLCFYMEFSCSPIGSSCLSAFLTSSNNMKICILGSECLLSWLVCPVCLCVVKDFPPIQRAYPSSRPTTAKNRQQPPTTTQQRQVNTNNGWMDSWCHGISNN